MTNAPRLSWLQRLNRKSWMPLRADHTAPLNDPDQIRGLHRLIRIIDDDTIELRSFSASKRWIWLFVTVLILGGWAFAGPMSKNVSPLPKPLLGLIAPEYYGEWIVSDYEQAFYKDEPLEAERRARWVAAETEGARAEWKAGVFFLIAFTVPPLYWLFAPIPRGVRVDRRRKLIYSWKGCRFYCVGTKSADLTEFEAFYAAPGPAPRRQNEYGHLIYALPRASDPGTTRSFRLGRGPTPNYNQFTLMHNAAASFLYHKQDPDWLVKCKTTPRGRNNYIDWIAALASFHLIPAWWPRSTRRRLDRFAEESR